METSSPPLSIPTVLAPIWYISGMVAGSGIEKYQQIAFSTGDKSFVMFNWSNLTATIQTSLVDGTHCNIISGDSRDPQDNP
jgi:hypothetical protein